MTNTPRNSEAHMCKNCDAYIEPHNGLVINTDSWYCDSVCKSEHYKKIHDIGECEWCTCPVYINQTDYMRIDSKLFCNAVCFGAYSDYQEDSIDSEDEDMIDDFFGHDAGWGSKTLKESRKSAKK